MTTPFERIEAIAWNGLRLSSILELSPDAQEIAEKLDRAHAGRAVWAVSGSPVALKGNVDRADRMTTAAGSLAMAGSVPAYDVFIAARLRQAGAVIRGKANLSE